MNQIYLSRASKSTLANPLTISTDDDAPYETYLPQRNPVDLDNSLPILRRYVSMICTYYELRDTLDPSFKVVGYTKVFYFGFLLVPFI